MTDIIIKKKDIEKFGKKLMKKVYKFFHDKHTLSFEEMNIEKYKIEKNLILHYFELYDDIEMMDDSILNICLKILENKIKDEKLSIDFIFKILNNVKLDFEINGELYVEKKAFLDIYNVFDFYYKFSKD